MVYGATGAIGSAAVQLLKHFGAIVTAVCNSKYMDLVKSLGADAVIDYQRQDFTKTESRFDFIFDAVGKSLLVSANLYSGIKGFIFPQNWGKMVKMCSWP